MNAQHAGVQVALAMKLGAKAVIIANNGSTGFFRMTQTGYDGTISIPSASMPQNSARYLWNALAAGSTLYVSFSPYELPAGDQSAPIPGCVRCCWHIVSCWWVPSVCSCMCCPSSVSKMGHADFLLSAAHLNTNSSD